MSNLLRVSRLFALAAVVLLLTLTCTKSPAGMLATPYTNPAQFTSIPFGFHSHWLQPWRAYLETIPATTFLQGIGIQWNVSDSANPEPVAQMLSQQGIARARVEVSWNNIDFDDETRLIEDKATNLRSRLLALKKYGIRPLILLNAHHGYPCPTKFDERSLTVNACAGDTLLPMTQSMIRMSLL